MNFMLSWLKQHLTRSLSLLRPLEHKIPIFSWPPHNMVSFMYENTPVVAFFFLSFIYLRENTIISKKINFHSLLFSSAGGEISFSITAGLLLFISPNENIFRVTSCIAFKSLVIAAIV